MRRGQKSEEQGGQPRARLLVGATSIRNAMFLRLRHGTPATASFPSPAAATRLPRRQALVQCKSRSEKAAETRASNLAPSQRKEAGIGRAIHRL